MACADVSPLDGDSVAFLGDCALNGRVLVLDMLAAAGTGHMGMALGCAEIGAVLFGEFLRCDGSDPSWIDRDRFVLSAGHGSAFLYAWMHMAGFPVSAADLRAFRRGGRARSHPEFCRSLGVECTTGPLGQGIANAVGMALSQQLLAARFGDDVSMLQGRTVCLAGDGCMQEGVAMEAFALAGLWELGNLIVIYDDNGITLDGASHTTNGRNCKATLEALGWTVREVDGHDLNQIAAALRMARQFPCSRPQAIIAKTIAAKGVDSAVCGDFRCHGLPLSREELVAAREKLAPLHEPFTIFPALAERWRAIGERRRKEREAWTERLSMVFERNSNLLEILSPEKFDGNWLLKNFPKFSDTPSPTRRSASAVLQEVARRMPNLVSVGADVFSSVGTTIGDSPMLSADNTLVRNIQCGAREHVMGAIGNGLAFDGIFRPLASTFLVFSDYLRPPMRIGAMAKLPIIYVFSHDSIAVGEDGPTHQPVEMIPSLRALPGLDVVRPADADECVAAFAIAVDNCSRPTALIMSRQPLPPIAAPAELRRCGARRGAYVVRPEKPPLRSIAMASGGELHMLMEAAEDFPHCRVVSMPCMEVFERQEISYKNEVIDPDCGRRLAVEAAGPQPWLRYAKWENVIAVHGYGECLDGDTMLRANGFSVENIRNNLRRIGEE
jgi:transketolase